MCGIAGVISKDISACFDDALVMSEKLLHRGRDGVGFLHKRHQCGIFT